jgi:hypothetical protein
MTPGSVSPANACAQTCDNVIVKTESPAKMREKAMSNHIIHLSWVCFDVPVEDAANKWRNESASELGCRDSLGHAEHEREVAGDALLLENLGDVSRRAFHLHNHKQ